jgi:DNA-binding MarR family transcriptional regulator
MSSVAPFTATEEVLWRAFMRLVITVPRALNDDLARTRGMNSGEYTTLMFLSEAPNQQMRISDLASASALSLSRMSRLLDDLQAQKLVVKRRSEADGRGALACLTRQGLAKLKSAWPDHLASVRRLFLDQLSEADKVHLARILEPIASHVDQATRRQPA